MYLQLCTAPAGAAVRCAWRSTRGLDHPAPCSGGISPHGKLDGRRRRIIIAQARRCRHPDHRPEQGGRRRRRRRVTHRRGGAAALLPATILFAPAGTTVELGEVISSIPLVMAFVMAPSTMAMATTAAAMVLWEEQEQSL